MSFSGVSVAEGFSVGVLFSADAVLLGAGSARENLESLITLPGAAGATQCLLVLLEWGVDRFSGALLLHPRCVTGHLGI